MACWWKSGRLPGCSVTVVWHQFADPRCYPTVSNLFSPSSSGDVNNNKFVTLTASISTYDTTPRIVTVPKRCHCFLLKSPLIRTFKSPGAAANLPARAPSPWNLFPIAHRYYRTSVRFPTWRCVLPNPASLTNFRPNTLIFNTLRHFLSHFRSGAIVWLKPSRDLDIFSALEMIGLRTLVRKRSVRHFCKRSYAEFNERHAIDRSRGWPSGCAIISRWLVAIDQVIDRAGHRNLLDFSGWNSAFCQTFTCD